MKISELFPRKVWLCYTAKDRGNKVEKLPIKPATGEIGQGRETCVTYEEARNYLKNPVGAWASGIGLMTLDGVAFIDLDNVLEGGDFSASIREDLPDLVEFVEGLPASTYVEISRSGNGLHIIGIDEDNAGPRTRKMTIAGRDIGFHRGYEDEEGKYHPQYVAITRKPFKGFTTSEINDLSGIIRAFFDFQDAHTSGYRSAPSLFSVLPSNGEASQPGEYPQEVASLINSGHFSSRWKSQFSSLWQGQPREDQGDTSPSGIDYNLCIKLAELVTSHKIAFQENTEDIKRFFRLSPWYSRKTPEKVDDWQRLEARTVEKALNYVLAKSVEDHSTRKEEEDRESVSVGVDESPEKDRLEALDLAQDEAAKTMDGVAEFIAHFSSQPEKPVKTGFKNLDGLLSGGLYPGLYLFGGVPGAGKTTFLLQLARQVLANNPGKEVLYFGVETSKMEVFGKLLSGFLLEKYGLARDYRTLTSGFLATPGEDAEAVRVAGTVLSTQIKGRLLVYPQRPEGYAVSSIEGFIKKHSGSHPLVLVDYLQIVGDTSPGASKKTEKERTDYKAGVFSNLAKTCGVPIVLVTSLNRASYSGNAGRLQNTSMKESGGLEYACDLSLFLEGQVINQKDVEGGAGSMTPGQIWEDPKRQPREDEAITWNSVTGVQTKFTRIVINKNRLGKAGASNFQFAPAFSAYREDNTLVKYVAKMDEYFSTGVAVFGNETDPRAYKAGLQYSGALDTV